MSRFAVRKHPAGRASQLGRMWKAPCRSGGNGAATT